MFRQPLRRVSDRNVVVSDDLIRIRQERIRMSDADFTLDKEASRLAGDTRTGSSSRFVATERPSSKQRYFDGNAIAAEPPYDPVTVQYQNHWNAERG